MDETQHAVLTIILGGGRGTRLFPLTQYRCKPAVPLAGTYRLVDIPISNCLNAGYNRIFVLTQFLTASLHRHIHASFQFDPFSGGFVEILAAEQTDHSADWYQGTADAVRRNLQHFVPHAHDLVLILSGDQLYRMDFRDLVAQHVATGAEVHGRRDPGAGVTRGGSGPCAWRRIGRSRPSSRSPPTPRSYRASLSPRPGGHPDAAVCSAPLPRLHGHLRLRPCVLQAALDTPMTDFGQEVIPSLLGRVRLYAYVFEGYWADLGTVRAFFEANLALTQPDPPFMLCDPRAPPLHACALPAPVPHHALHPRSGHVRGGLSRDRSPAPPLCPREPLPD